MGYTTDFEGEITVTPPIPEAFRLRWEVAKQGTPGKPYVSSSRDKTPPDMLPGFEHPSKPQAWCNWQIEAQAAPDGTVSTAISWDWGEKFYEYDVWLQVLVDLIREEVPDALFEGTIEWVGEDHRDLGQLSVNEAGQVEVKRGTITYS